MKRTCEARTQRANARHVEIVVIFTGILPLSLLMTTASQIGKEFTTTKPDIDICKSSPSELLPFKTCMSPIKNETKLIIAATVIGTNMGDGTPKSKTPWSYLLLCSSSTTLLVKLKPYVEMPRHLRKYSRNANKQLESTLIIHIL